MTAITRAKIRICQKCGGQAFPEVNEYKKTEWVCLQCGYTQKDKLMEDK